MIIFVVIFFLEQQIVHIQQYKSHHVENTKIHHHHLRLHRHPKPKDRVMIGIFIFKANM